MSADGRVGGWADSTTSPTESPIATRLPTAHPPIRPTALVSIRDPPHPAAHVIRDQQRPVTRRHHAHRPPPARAVGQLPAGGEILDRDRPAVLDVDAHHLR